MSSEARCPVFGECGGCMYQDLPYAQELRIKETKLKGLLAQEDICDPEAVATIVASPKPYHYRNRLDLKMVRTRDERILIGFTPKAGWGIVPIEACPIAERAISEFIPQLKQHILDHAPMKYRRANLVVRTGTDKRVRWGGIGRRSCRLSPEDYFWTDLNGRRIFYSLDTFFQANLSILPLIVDALRALPFWRERPHFYDLYGGVGLFGIGVADLAAKVVLIEESAPSLKLARHNVEMNGLADFKVMEGKVEECLASVLETDSACSRVAMIDPPRAGLSPSALKMLSGSVNFAHILYLSCNPEALARDLKTFLRAGWNIERVMPFDFFPKTPHLETLVVLKHRLK